MATARYATFFLDNQLIGIPVSRVDEVLATARLTRVPMAPPAVAGLLNLRGEIVVAQDLRVTLYRPLRGEDEAPVHVVVRMGNEAVSLMFDKAGDVVDVDAADIEPPPSTFPHAVKSVTSGVVPRKGHVLLLLDLDRVTVME